jgi:biopolymer transport protein ExbB
MNVMTIKLCAFLLAAASLAQQPAENETVSRLSRTAEQDLAKTTQQLAQLRETITTEKLPLAQELTTLEQSVTQLRRDHDKVTRLVDAGNLELPQVKGEIKARQEELSYIGNLLDEYARTFDTTLNVSELQRFSAAIENAKQATENTTLPMTEKFTRQTEFAKASVERLLDAIGGMRFAGVGVDSEGVVSEGQFAVIGPVGLFRAKTGAAGVVVAQTGSTKPLIRPLEGAAQQGIGDVVEKGEGTMPLDPTRGGALRELVQKTNLFHIFQKGGPIMWPLLFASVLALGTVLERMLFMMNERRRRDPKALERLLGEVERGENENAIHIGKKSKDYVVRTLTYALEHKERSLSNAIMYAQAQELKRFKRGIPILDTVITLAPLLGLLGTVTGMMGSFSSLSGELSAPGAITGGIAEALIATAFGLGIAITCLLPFNFLNSRMEDARHEIEQGSQQLELLVRPRMGAVLQIA